jgi:hypothetical protein
MNPNEPLSIFLIGGVGTRKTFTLMVIIQGFLQYYFKQNKDLDPSKQKNKFKWHTHEKLHIILVDQHYMIINSIKQINQ